MLMARRLHPVARPEEVRPEARLGRAGRRAPVVAPGRERRQRGEDRLAASPGLQPEARAAILQQVELDGAAAPPELEVALALAPERVLAPRQDRLIGGQEVLGHAAQEREGALEAALAPVVEEQAADAARLVAVREEEVAVAPGLEARVELRA